MNAYQNWDTRLDQVETFLEDAATARAEAEAAEERRKQVLAAMTIHFRDQSEKCGIAEADARARSSVTYKDAANAWIAANYAYRKADAKAEAAKLRIEVWRTKSASERAAMQMR